MTVCKSYEILAVAWKPIAIAMYIAVHYCFVYCMITTKNEKKK